MMKERKRAEMKRGYCELCQIKYENIDQVSTIFIPRIKIEVDEQFIVNTQMLVTREYLPLTRQTVLPG